MEQGAVIGVPGATVDARLPTPLYHQIYLILRGKISDGSYPDNALLPGEQEISRQFGVSRITAKRALDELAGDGLAIRQRGRGTRVRFQAPQPVVCSSVEGLLENLLAMGLETKVKLLAFAYVPAGDAVAAALDCAPGATVQQAVRVRSLRGEPFSHLATHVPEDVGRSYTRNDLAKTPLLALLERCGVVVSSAEQTITATLADTQVAPALGIGVGSPLLAIRRIVRDQDDRPIEYITALYRPDRYQYRMMLTRVRGEDFNIWSPTDPAAPHRKARPQHATGQHATGRKS